MTIRLAFLVNSPSKGAHGNAAGRLALGLVETGKIEPTLLCYTNDPRPSWLPPEVHIHRLAAGRATRSLPSLVRYLRTEQPDVLITRQVHANFVGLAAAGMARVPPGWRGKLVLVQDALAELSHTSSWRDNKWVAKMSYRFADGLIAPSRAVLDDTARWCGLDPSSTALVPNPVPRFPGTSSPPPHPWLRDGEPPVFVSISNLLPFKRVDLLIDAFADLRQSHDVRLLILGEGPTRIPAAEQIQRLGLGSSAAAIGWIDDPLQFTARAWALVHTSDEEGFGQVLVEAMSTNCPVITTDGKGGGPRFVTDDGKYGVLVPKGDRAELIAAMTRMLQPEFHARYAELGMQRADSLSPAASAKILIEFLSAQLGVNA
jgi:glycosyltransferase involved in cell wall biosynthesis